jgi:ABC-type phosphate/phosphonate transport system substrate-binding protein
MHMSEGLSKAEQELIEVAGFCNKRLMLMGLEGSIGILMREIERSGKTAALPPHAAAVRISLAADLAEKLEKVLPVLTDLSQKLAVFQDEQVKKL